MPAAALAFAKGETKKKDDLDVGQANTRLMSDFTRKQMQEDCPAYKRLREDKSARWDARQVVDYYNEEAKKWTEARRDPRDIYGIEVHKKYVELYGMEVHKSEQCFPDTGMPIYWIMAMVPGGGFQTKMAREVHVCVHCISGKPIFSMVEEDNSRFEFKFSSSIKYVDQYTGEEDE